MASRPGRPTVARPRLTSSRSDRLGYFAALVDLACREAVVVYDDRSDLGGFPLVCEQQDGEADRYRKEGQPAS